MDCPSANLNDLDWNDIVDTTEMCAKCARTSTTFYPLTFVTIDNSLVKKRKYGKQIRRFSQRVCHDCNTYLTCSKPQWEHSWPAVLFTFAFSKNISKYLDRNQKFYSILPYQIQTSWLAYAKTIWPEVIFTPLFRDLTNNIKHFHQLIRTTKANDYIKAMNCYSFPSIRCFCGASTHLDSCGFVSFKHLLNYLDEEFISFGANYKSNLMAIRYDFFQICDSRIVFELRPAVVSDSRGLMLLTCQHHNSGSKMRMVHVPRHPLVGNLSHPHADRMAPVASSFREATPMKLGNFSNTWSLSKSVHGKDGAGSLVLHSERNLCVKSQSLLPALESVHLNNRNDMVHVVGQIAQENFLPPTFVKNLFRQYKAPDLPACLDAATIIPQSTTNKLKTFYETTTSVENNVLKFKKLCVVDSCTQHTMMRLVYPDECLIKQDSKVATLVFFFLNCPLFANVFISNNISPSLEKLFNIILKTKDQRTKLNLLQNLLTSFYGDLQMPANANFSTFITCFIHSLNNPTFVVVTSLDLFHEIDGKPDVVFIAPFESRTKIPDSITSRKSNDIYQVMAVHGGTFGRGVFYYSNHGFFWKVNLDTKKFELSSLPEKSRRVDFALLVRSDQQESPVYGYPSEIGHVACPEHKKPFCIEVSNSRFLCSYNVSCICKVAWRCPNIDCGFSLCKKHYQNYEEANTSLIQRCKTELNFHAPTGSVSSEFHLDTDAGSTSVSLDFEDNLQGEVVSMHALLNHLTSVLRRNDPIQATKSLKRFFQRFLCTHSSSSSSLVQLEALLFPSIFYYQLHDGSYPGAIPFFLYGNEKDCSEFGFDSLLLHFRTRINDPTLLTSSNAKYLQFAADTLLNLNLRGKHTKSYIQRGLQSIELDKNVGRSKSSCNQFSSDTEMRVDELGSAMRTNPLTLFVTLSCNQKSHPGVAPLKQAMDFNFNDATLEERKSAAQAYMPLFVRNWARAVKYLIDLLIHSSEKVLGQILKLWGRAEFQTLDGNLQHYHFLIWLVEGMFGSFEFVQCCEKHILHSLLKVADSSLNLIEDENHLYQLYDECVRFNTHNCEINGGRCMKRKDLEGNKICRSPPFPPSHSHWIMPIETQYPNEALKVLEKLDLAERIPGTKFGLRPKGQLKSDKVMYAATKGEHILPTSVPLFCITRSSTNVLITTQRFSCSYLSSYSTKTEEHADGRILPAQDGKTFSLRTEGIQNKFLASSKILNRLEKEKERKREKIDCRIVSLTESVFWTLGLPYVITTMDFIHVQNVPPELRNVQQRVGMHHRSTTYSDFREKIDGLNNFHLLTNNQKIMAADLCNSGQTDDQMSSFSLRPPELLVVNKLELFCSWFVYEPSRIPCKELISIFKNNHLKPWINARGRQVKLRPSALNDFRDFLSARETSDYTEAVQYNQTVLAAIAADEAQKNFYVADSEKLSKTNAEVVFATVHPRRTIDFLVSFILRFGEFETELDIFQCNDLLESYIRGKLVTRGTSYNEDTLMTLLDIYVKKELMYLPGGSLTFSHKLLTAKRAFSSLLHMDNSDFCDTPVVLISDMRERVNRVVDSFFDSRLNNLFTSLKRLRIPNLPTEYLPWNNPRHLWRPQITFEPDQSPESKREQTQVINDLLSAVNGVLCTTTPTLKNNHIVIGKLFNFFKKCKSR